ncbi:hypothetical protein J3458_004829 [Metarhizium acridum]|uniref:uncharacterized protein n=1 Tax=Metarhizium acridum TaxID=92637 RepID=UPI001C6C8001|nr:hypothetical protein J3458_004829 [Metarhizium acridum]KAG8420012.1 hypothetical protein J3458_004829 [Metarhizium acridum]KAG8420013.1 hypothetical protein J3458_004829 [Metarhizium acridum]
MRFTTFLVSGALAAVAVAQSATTSASVAESSAEACLKNCPESDVKCRAHCIPVPSPNDQNVANTDACIRKCNQGDGSAEQSKAYGECKKACEEKYYYVSSEGTPQATGGTGNNGNSGGSASGSDASPTATATATGTGASPSRSASGTGSSGSRTTGSGSASGTQTGTGASATKTGAAAGLTIGSSGAFVGALAALLAL